MKIYFITGTVARRKFREAAHSRDRAEVVIAQIKEWRTAQNMPGAVKLAIEEWEAPDDTPTNQAVYFLNRALDGIPGSA